MVNDKSSIMFIGRYGLMFTDEDGIRYSVHTENTGDGINLLKEGIVSINSNKVLNVQDRERIVSKILSLKPEIKWQVK